MTSPFNPDWRQPPAKGIIQPGEVHLWLVDFPLVREHLISLAGFLSPDDEARASRFLFPEDRERFILSRGALREILSRYLGHAPGEILFTYTRQGKPILAREIERRDISFNVSHTESLALIAIYDGRQIGVDVEMIDQNRMTTAVARRFFSPSEVEKLLALPAEVRESAFFNGWTRKEAYLKAIGAGLTMSLDAIEVTLAPGEDARILKIAGDSVAASKWTLIHLVPKPGYVGALVAEGHPDKLICYRWQISEPLSGANQAESSK